MSPPLGQSTEWFDIVPTNMRYPTLFGLTVLIASLAGFGIWAVTAPLHSAVIAPGRFVAHGQNKVIQHLEGGIIRHIKVKEGDLVKRGQVLITLEDTSAKANLRLLNHRYHRFMAQQARLIAESKWSDEIQFPANLKISTHDEGDDNIPFIISRQRDEFSAHREKLTANIEILEHETAIREEAITGFREEIESVDAQLRLIDEELKNKTLLYKQQLAILPKLLDLKKSRAQLVGRSGRLTANIAEQKMEISKTRKEIRHLRAAAVDQAFADLRQIEGELDDIREQQRKAQDVLQRVDITAPVDAVIVKLMHHTPGAVIKPGGEIMELVPIDGEPIIEARVQPRDIDKVKKGQFARVRLTALDQRLTPTVPGHVVYVSADTVDDRRSGNGPSGYIVRIVLKAENVTSLKAFHPVPGMPAEAFIETGERTFFSYLTRPLLDSMARAFREH